MIRVLHVVTYMGRGGLETMLMNYYRNIDRSKIQFDFLVHRDFKADYDDEIESLGGRIYHISRLIPWSIKYKKELRNFFTAHPEYKIVHVHQDCLSSVALKCAKECGIPVRIAHSHNSNQDKNIKYLIKRYYMQTIPNYATDLMACSVEAGDWMYKGANYRIVHNAINLDSYMYSRVDDLSIRKEFDIENKLVIGHVGRFRTQKNHLFLIRIFNEIIKKQKNSVLLLVGDGEEMGNAKKLVDELHLNSSVIFAGSRSDVNRLMSCMNIFVFPSLFEGLPLSLIEAQASGLRCIVSDCISDESIITSDQVIKMSLDDSVVKWADVILDNIESGRYVNLQDLKQSGYDIKTEVINLQSYYEKKIEELSK